MIIAQFQFPPLTIHPVKGVEQFTLPYYERIVCSDYKVNTMESVILYGAYRGEATIIFSLDNVDTFSFINEETGLVIEKWERRYFNSGDFVKYISGNVKEERNVNDRSVECSKPN